MILRRCCAVSCCGRLGTPVPCCAPPWRALRALVVPFSSCRVGCAFVPLAFSALCLVLALFFVGPLGWGVRCASFGAVFPTAVCSFAQGSLSVPFACVARLFSLRVHCAIFVALVMLCWCCVVLVCGNAVHGVSDWYAGAVVEVVFCGACGWVVCGVSSWYAGAVVVVVMCRACWWVACSVLAWYAGAVVVVVLCGVCGWVACGMSAWDAGAVVAVVLCGACG